MRATLLATAGAVVGSVIGITLGRRYLEIRERQRKLRAGWILAGVHADGSPWYVRRLPTWRDEGYGTPPSWGNR